MKFGKATIFAAAFILTVSFLITSCGADKDKTGLIKFYKTSIEFIKSPGYKDMLKSNPAQIVDKMNQLFKESGLTLGKEQMDIPDHIDALKNKFKDDAEVKKLADEYDKAIADVQTQVFEEKMKEEQAKMQMPTEETMPADANAPTIDNPQKDTKAGKK